jgi:hypothetical protein
MVPLPKMSAYRSWISPYNYVQNNPVMRQDPKGMLDVGLGGPGPSENALKRTVKICTWFKKKLGDFKTWSRQFKNENELPVQSYLLEEVPVTYEDDRGKSIFTYASEGMYETNPIGAFLIDISAIGLRDFSPLGNIYDAQLTLRDEELDVHDGINLAANIFQGGAGIGKWKGRRPNIKTKNTLRRNQNLGDDVSNQIKKADNQVDLDKFRDQNGELKLKVKRYMLEKSYGNSHSI